MPLFAQTSQVVATRNGDSFFFYVFFVSTIYYLSFLEAIFHLIYVYEYIFQQNENIQQKQMYLEGNKYVMLHNAAVLLGPVPMWTKIFYFWFKKKELPMFLRNIRTNGKRDRSMIIGLFIHNCKLKHGELLTGCHYYQHGKITFIDLFCARRWRMAMTDGDDGWQRPLHKMFGICSFHQFFPWHL